MDQARFIKRVRKLYPAHFRNSVVVDIGSRSSDNGRYFSGKTWYMGIDLHEGEGVNIIGAAHEQIPIVNMLLCKRKEVDIRAEAMGHLPRINPDVDRPISVVISTECLQYDSHWQCTLLAMYDFLQPGGLMMITAFGAGGKPITNEMIQKSLQPSMFDAYNIEQRIPGFAFYGVKTFRR